MPPLVDNQLLARRVIAFAGSKWRLLRKSPAQTGWRSTDGDERRDSARIMTKIANGRPVRSKSTGAHVKSPPLRTCLGRANTSSASSGLAMFLKASRYSNKHESLGGQMDARSVPHGCWTAILEKSVDTCLSISSPNALRKRRRKPRTLNRTNSPPELQPLRQPTFPCNFLASSDSRDYPSRGKYTHIDHIMNDLQSYWHSEAEVLPQTRCKVLTW